MRRTFTPQIVLLTLGLFLACGDPNQAPPKNAIDPQSTPSPKSTSNPQSTPLLKSAGDPQSTPRIVDGRIQVALEHRRCSSDDECDGFYAVCGNCDGDCSGVNKKYKAIYVEASGGNCLPGSKVKQTGKCNYDCDPRFGIEKVSCVEGLCRMEKEP